MAIDPNDLPAPALKKYNDFLRQVQTMIASKGNIDEGLIKKLATDIANQNLTHFLKLAEAMEKSPKAKDDKDAVLENMPLLTEANRQALEMGYLTEDQRKQLDEDLKKLQEPEKAPALVIAPELQAHYDNVVKHPALNGIQPEHALAIATHASDHLHMTPDNLQHGLDIAHRKNNKENLLTNITDVVDEVQKLLKQVEPQVKAFEHLNPQERNQADDFMHNEGYKPSPHNVAQVIGLRKENTALNNMELKPAVDAYRDTRTEITAHPNFAKVINQINKTPDNNPPTDSLEMKHAIDVATAYALTRPTAEAVSAAGVGNAMSAAGVAPTAQVTTVADIANAAVAAVKDNPNQVGDHNAMMSSVDNQLTAKKNQNAAAPQNTLDAATAPSATTHSTPTSFTSPSSAPRPPGAATGGGGA